MKKITITNTRAGKKDHTNRDCILAVKVTAEEKGQIVDFAAKRCINVSALVRKLLFEQLDSNEKEK